MPPRAAVRVHARMQRSLTNLLELAFFSVRASSCAQREAQLERQHLEVSEQQERFREREMEHHTQEEVRVCQRCSCLDRGCQWAELPVVLRASQLTCHWHAVHWSIWPRAVFTLFI